MTSIINNEGTIIKVIDERGNNKQGAKAEMIKWGFNPDAMYRFTEEGKVVYASDVSRVDVTLELLELVMTYKNLFIREVKLDDKLRHMAHYVVHGMALNNQISTQAMCKEIIKASEEVKYKICYNIIAARLEYWSEC